MTAITPSQPSEERAPLRSTAVTIAALAILIGVGIWRATHSATAPLPTSAAQAGTTLPAGAAPAIPARPDLIVYLVGSAEKRDSVQANLKLAEVAQMPEVPLTWLVVDVTTPGGEALAREVASVPDLMRPDGRPAVMLVDLRTKAQTPTDSD
jgi:hypothetical protein